MDTEKELEEEVIERSGGEGEIRTHEALTSLPVFKTGALDHSATSPSDGSIYDHHWAEGNQVWFLEFVGVGGRLRGNGGLAGFAAGYLLTRPFYVFFAGLGALLLLFDGALNGRGLGFRGFVFGR